MKIALIGQQDFGRAVLAAFLSRGDDVAGVFCAPEKDGAKPDLLRLLALEHGIPIFQFGSLKTSDAADALRSLDVDIGVMAFVLQFAPQAFVQIPKHGMIQYHPSLLPKYRGPSSINWPISRGDAETGLTIFRPTDGLDEGAVILQKRTPISNNDTLGTVYFDRLFPMGVAALLEASDAVVAGTHSETIQDETDASYEGWFRASEAHLNWHNHVDTIHNLIRAADPAPGAWTTLAGKRVHLFASAMQLTHTFSDVKGKPGEVVAIGDVITISAQGGQISVAKLKQEDGKKLSAVDFAATHSVGVGARFGE